MYMYRHHCSGTINYATSLITLFRFVTASNQLTINLDGSGNVKLGGPCRFVICKDILSIESIHIQEYSWRHFVGEKMELTSQMHMQLTSDRFVKITLLLWSNHSLIWWQSLTRPMNTKMVLLLTLLQ